MSSVFCIYFTSPTSCFLFPTARLTLTSNERAPLGSMFQVEGHVFLHYQVVHLLGLALEIAKSTILAHLVLVLSLGLRGQVVDLKLEQIGLRKDASPLASPVKP